MLLVLINVALKVLTKAFIWHLFLKCIWKVRTAFHALYYKKNHPNLQAVETRSATCKMAIISVIRWNSDSGLSVNKRNNFKPTAFKWISGARVNSMAIRLVLTRFPLKKRAAISQTTFSYAFSWMKNFVFRFKFHWSLFLRVQWRIIQQWFR